MRRQTTCGWAFHIGSSLSISLEYPSLTITPQLMSYRRRVNVFALRVQSFPVSWTYWLNTGQERHQRWINRQPVTTPFWCIITNRPCSLLCQRPPVALVHSLCCYPSASSLSPLSCVSVYASRSPASRPLASSPCRWLVSIVLWIANLTVIVTPVFHEALSVMHSVIILVTERLTTSRPITRLSMQPASRRVLQCACWHNNDKSITVNGRK